MKWNEVVSILGAVQGVLVAVLLFFRTKNRVANRFLAAFVLLLTLSLTEYLYQPQLSGLVNSAVGGLVFLYGPLVFFYGKTLLGDDLSRSFLIRHGAVPGLYWALLSLSSAGGWGDHELLDFALSNVFFLHVFWYSGKALKRVRQERRLETSAAQPAMLHWLQILVSLLAVVYGLAFVAMYLLVFNIPQAGGLLRIIQAGCVVVVYALSYWTLIQPDLEVSRREIAREVAKYQHSTLTEADKQQHLHRITSYLAKQKPWLEPELTLDKLAKELGINRFYVSQVINEQLGKSFSDLINGYRITEAKRLLLDPAKAHYSMVGVGFEAGFNSKTAFNTTFKKLTGQSPSDYRKSAQQGVPLDQTEQ
ncbi:helix-turn-helix domain-containing protein [Spirosoma areae]